MKFILWIHGKRVYESNRKLADVKDLAAAKICAMYGVSDAASFLPWEVVAYGKNNKAVLYKAKGLDCIIAVQGEE